VKIYRSKLNIKWSDHTKAIALWFIAIVFTLGFAAIPFQLWLAKLILDNWEITEEEQGKPLTVHELRQAELERASRPRTEHKFRSQWD
tara:strand:- start:1528 stop:1791 length:264 start_codon:yes stop_codon:yes gene_type:complete